MAVELPTLIQRLVLDSTGFKTGAAAAAASFRSTASDADTHAKKVTKSWLTASQGLNDLGKVGLVVGGVLTAALGGSVAAAAAFEREMRNVASLSTVVQNDFKRVSDQVVEMSRNLPQSAKVLAAGLYDIVSSGKDGAEAMVVLEASAKAASAGMTNTAVAAKGISAVLNAYGTSGFEAAKVSDILFQTVNKGVLSFEELASNLGDFVGTAAVLKVPIEDAAAALATMTLSGINAAEASTALNRVFLGFIDPSDAMTEALKRNGYESGSAAIQALGLKGAIELLGRETGGSAEAMRSLFPEVRGMKGALALLAVEGENYNVVAKAITDESQRMGATQRAYNEQAKSFSFQLEVAKNNLNALGIEIGTRMLPVLSSFLSGLTSLVDFFADLPGPVQAVATALAILTAAAGLLGGSFLLLAPRVLAMRELMGGLATTAPRLATALGTVSKAMGIVGIAFAAFTVAASIYASSQKDAAKATEEFRVAIERERQGLEGATDAAIKARLVADGLIGQAGRMGVSYDDLAAAIKGSDDAWKRVSRTGNEVVGTIGRQEGALSGLGTRVDANTVGARSFDGAVLRLRASLAEATKKVEDQEKATGLLMEVTGKSKKELVELGLATETTGDKIEEAAQTIGLTSKVLARFGVDSEDAAKAFAKAVQSVMDTTLKAFQRDFDVVAQFSASSWEKMQSDAEKGAEGIAAAEEKLADARRDLLDLQTRQGAANATSVTDAQALRNAEENLAKVLANSKSTTEQVTTARERLADVQERVASKAGQSVTEFQALEKAERKVADATKDLEDAQAKGSTAIGSMTDEISRFYRESLAEAETFNANISKAIQMGLDPTVVTRLLQEGPKAAAPLLQEIVGSHGSALVEMMNLNEKALAKSGNIAVETARLTQLAITSKSGEMVRDLKDAMRIAQLEADSGGTMTIGALAVAMERSYSDVQSIVDRFGLLVPTELTRAGKDGAAGFTEGMAPIVPSAENFLRAVEKSVKDYIGPLPPTMTNLAGQIASNWKVGIDPMPGDTNAVMYLLDQNVRGKLAPLAGYTDTTAKDMAVFWRLGLDPMPRDTGQRADATAQVLKDALSPLPEASRRTAVELVGSWLKELAKGEGGTSEQTAAWARAMLDQLNPLLTGVGAPEIRPGDYQRQLENAEGNVYENHEATVAKAGTPARLWAEPETQGEAYIPFAPSKRRRSTGILDYVAGRFGYGLVPMAFGGVLDDEGLPLPPTLGEYGHMVGYTGEESSRHTYEAIKGALADKRAEQAAATGGGGGGQPYTGGDIGSGWEQITGYLDSKGQDYQVTSTYREGDPGFHGRGKAVDLVGDMGAIFSTLAAGNPVPGINELFYDPMGYFYDEGSRASGAIGGHDDHVHAATFDKGGILQPGLTMAYNGTGRPEVVMPFAAGGVSMYGAPIGDYKNAGPGPGMYQTEDGYWIPDPSFPNSASPRYFGQAAPSSTPYQVPSPPAVSVPSAPRPPSFSVFGDRPEAAPPLDLTQLARLIEEAILAVMRDVTAHPLRAYVVADEVEAQTYYNGRSRG